MDYLANVETLDITWQAWWKAARFKYLPGQEIHSYVWSAHEEQ